LKRKERYIAIGDVHGCHEELETLLKKIGPGPRDQVVMLGDLVNHGPDSHRSLALARETDAICLLGNHERRLLLHRKTGMPRILKKVERETLAQLTEEDWRQLEKMALYHYVPELEAVFVHGGFLPGRPWQIQPADIVTRIQVVDERGRARKRSQSPGAPHWSQLWKGPPFVVYGHTPRPQYSRLQWSIGLDTACVQGGHLTAFILPEKKIVQVKARRSYI
jgi:serine/threonine protein phosphatase 1